MQNKRASTKTTIVAVLRKAAIVWLGKSLIRISTSDSASRITTSVQVVGVGHLGCECLAPGLVIIRRHLYCAQGTWCALSLPWVSVEQGQVVDSLQCLGMLRPWCCLAPLNCPLVDTSALPPSKSLS